MDASGCLVKFYEDPGHIVAAHLLRGVLGHQEVQQLRNHSLHILAAFALLNYFVNHPLAVVYIFFPNAVTAHNYELVVLGPVRDRNVGLADDQLLIVGQVLIPLVEKVPKGARQIQTSVYSAIANGASGLGDTGLFDFALRFVILGQWDSFP